MRAMLLFIAFISTGLVDAQLTLTVLSGKDRTPITSANIQAINSGKGWVSDDKGNFSINQSSLVEYLLITHVSFEDKIVKLSSVDGPIHLKERSRFLKDIEVSGSRDRQWKKDLKKFNRELFGRSSIIKKVEIINPWVIDFQHVSGGLIATANSLIRIENQYTGYQINFALESFSNKGSISTYNGKAFFKELDGDYKSNREKTFEGSLRHFLFSVQNNISRKEGFRVFECVFDKQTNSFLTKKAIKTKNLGKRENDKWTLDFDGYIKVIYLKESDINSFGSDAVSNESGQVSYLKCNSPILIDELGNAKNAGLQDFGYWANVERVTHWLPHDYLPDRLSSIDH